MFDKAVGRCLCRRSIVFVLTTLTVLTAASFTVAHRIPDPVAIYCNGSRVGWGLLFQGSVYVPVRLVSEGIGATVEYDKEANRVDVSSPTSSATVTDDSPLEFNGSQNKKTQPFTMRSKRWRIRWRVRPDGKDNFVGIFRVELKDVRTDRHVQTIASTTEAGGETTYVYDSGEFYLDINASAKYEIEILPE